MSLLDRILPPKLNKTDEQSFGLDDWRRWFGSVMALFFVVVLPVVFFLAYPIYVGQKLYSLAFFTGAAWLLLLLRLIFRSSKIFHGKLLWIAVVYIFAFFLLVSLGPTYARSAWFVFAAVLASLFYGYRGAMIASCVNALSIFFFYFLMDPSNSVWARTYELGFDNWAMFSMSTGMLSLGASLPTGFLLVRLDRALKREQAVNEQLAQEKSQLGRANEELQSQMRERALAKMALMESEEKLRLMADNLTDAMIYQVVAGRDGARRFVYVSRSIERLNEVTAEEVIADYSVLYGQVAPECVDELAAKEARALENRTTFRHTIKCVLPSGRERWFDLAATPRPMPDGSTIWDGVQINVTDREQAKEALRESENLYRVLVDNSHNGILLVDDAYHIKYVNEEYCNILGYGQDELLGQDFRQFLAEETKDVPVKRYLAKLRGEETVSLYDFMVKRKDGYKRWVRASSSEIESAKGERLFMGQLLDITERKAAEDALRESESLYRTLVDNSHDGIVLLDDSFRFNYVNDEYCNILGYAREELLGRDFRQFLTEESRELTISHYLAKLRGEESISRYEFMVVRKDGTQRRLQATSSEIPNSKGQRLIMAQLLDITERKAAEDALRESENLYRALVENSHAGIMLLDNAGHLLYVNDELCGMTGYDSHELIGQELESLLAEETKHVPLGHYQARLRGEDAPHRYEYMIQKKDGVKRWVETSVSTTTNSKGEMFVLVQLLDNTGRKVAEEALRESENLYRTLVENSHDGVIILDDAFRFDYVNQEFCKIVDYSPAELLGRDFSLFLADETRHLSENYYKERMVGGSPPTRYEFMMTRKDGVKRWVETCSSVVTDAHGNKKNIAQLLDITDRVEALEALRHSEEKFRQVIQSSPMGVFICEMNPQGHLVIRDANPAAGDILGVDQDVLVDKEAAEAFPNIIGTDLYNTLRDIAAHGAAPMQGNAGFYKDDRVRGYFEVHAFQTAPGKLTVMFQDITERKKAEDERARLESQLRQSQKMEAVGTLTSGIAHDFNNILGAILGTTEASLLKGNEDISLAKSLGNIRDMSIRGRDLVRRLLSFSRQDEQTMHTLDIGELVDESMELIKAALPSNVTLEKQITHGLMVGADATQIQQVMLNLCTNAAHAMEEKGGVLSIKLSAKTLSQDQARMYPGLEAGPHVLLQVVDTGGGIPSHVLDRIFDPFFTTKPMGQGTGLGLSLVHGIIRSHHGTITAKSKEGQGSTMSLLLPQESRKDVAVEKPQEPAPMDGHGEHVMVVDDEEIIARSTAHILEAFGYRVSAYTSALEAAAALEDDPKRYALILTDHMMPGLTGRQLAEIAGELNPGLPVVLMTGMCGDTEERGQAGEVAKVLTKPVTIKEIGQAVRKVLDAQNQATAKASA